MRYAILAAALSCGCVTTAYGQAAPVIIGQPTALMLKAGTAIPLKTVTELTTKGKKLRVGQRFDLEVSEPITLDGKTVIPAGSRAIGEVTSVRNKGMWGKSGNIDARLISVRVNDRQIRLTGSMNDKGTTGTAGVVGAAVLIPVAGFFLTGTSAVIPPGAPVIGYLDEDLPVQFAEGTAPAPMVIAPAASSTVTNPAATAASNGN